MELTIVTKLFGFLMASTSYPVYPKDEATFVDIPDLGEVHTEYGESQLESLNEFHNAVVSGVLQIFKYKSCRSKIQATINCYG